MGRERSEEETIPSWINPLLDRAPAACNVGAAVAAAAEVPCTR